MTEHINKLPSGTGVQLGDSASAGVQLGDSASAGVQPNAAEVVTLDYPTPEEITQAIRDMLRRDREFRHKMLNMGYDNKEIVGVFDWQNETLQTQGDRTIPFDELEVDLVELFRSTKTKNTNKTLVTEDAAAYASELVESVDDVFGTSMQKRTNYTQDLMRAVFLYEMLLMNALEEELGMTDDEKMHLIGSNQLTQGVLDTSERLREEVRDHDHRGFEWHL